MGLSYEGGHNIDRYLAPAFGPGGVMEVIARSAVGPEAELTPDEIPNVILPPKDGPLPPRWQLIADAKTHIVETAKQQSEAVYHLAEQLGMRHPEALSSAELDRILPAHALWVAEGGANRTSVVRRGLALEAMERVYGLAAETQVLYQFGSDRRIPQMKTDPQTKLVKPNPEYAVAREIAGDCLPEGGELTEFGLNLASALQSGYQVVDTYQSQAEPRILRLVRGGSPALVLIQPLVDRSGLEDGFSAVPELAGSLAGCQFVIATNGQYRPKDELQAAHWAAEHEVDMLPAVVLGDEPGYTVPHAGRELVTGDRGPMVYVNEIAILGR
jgi:hypothetical protein